MALLELLEVLARAAAALACLQPDGSAALPQKAPPHRQHAPVALNGQHCPASQMLRHQHSHMLLHGPKCCRMAQCLAAICLGQ